LLRRNRRAHARIGRVEALMVLAVALLLAGGFVTWRVLLGGSSPATLPPIAEEISGSPPPLPLVTPLPPAGTTIPAGHVPILMYHYIRVNAVARDKAGFILSVTPANFAAQMQWAHDHGFHTVSLGDVYDALLHKGSMDNRAMVLTFDDGYLDFYTSALPVLETHRYTATAFVVTGFVGRPGYMSWTQLADAENRGMTIGSHTLTHPNLTRQPAAGLTAQVQGSRIELERHLQNPVLDFCYPSGLFNSKVTAAVEAAGYRDAATTAFAAFESLNTADTWPRVRISGGDSLQVFAQKLYTGISEYQRYGASPPPKHLPSPSSMVLGGHHMTTM
jgi:peptidoglycan/xylan/chitin deacetylase (PgdA/CDA1 family)